MAALALRDRLPAWCAADTLPPDPHRAVAVARYRQQKRSRDQTLDDDCTAAFFRGQAEHDPEHDLDVAEALYRERAPKRPKRRHTSPLVQWIAAQRDALHRTRTLLQVRRNRERRNALVVPRVAASLLDQQRGVADVEDMVGTARAFRLQRLLDDFQGVERHWCQRAIHWEMLLSVLPLLYRDDWSRRRHDILAFWGVAAPPRILLSIWSRRWGKSTSNTMFLAALTMVVGNLRVALYAGALLQAQLNIDAARTALQLLPNGAAHIVTGHSSKYQLCVTSRPSEQDPTRGQWCSILRALPTNADTMRGRGDDILFVDEAAYVPHAFYTETLFPMVSREGVVMWMCTTQSSDVHNLVTKMAVRILESKPPGLHAFWVTSQCEDCARHRRDCPHRRHWQPYWVTHEGVSMLEKLYPDRETFEREMLGRSDSRVDVAFPRELLESARDLGRWDAAVFSPDFIFVFVDPALGGQSDAAICALAFSPTGEHLVVVGWDARPTGAPDEIVQFGADFMGRLRTRRAYRRSRVVLMVEGNNGSTAAIEFMSGVLGTSITRRNALQQTRLESATAYLESQRGSPPPLLLTSAGLCNPVEALPNLDQLGVSASHSFWGEAVYFMREHLLGTDRLRVADDLVCTRQAVADEFWEQMARLERIPIVSNNRHADTVTYRYCGKRTGNDDLAKATMACAYRAELERTAGTLRTYSSAPVFRL